MTHDHKNHPFFDHVRKVSAVVVTAREDGTISWPERARIAAEVLDTIVHALRAGVSAEGLDCEEVADFAVALYDEYLADYNFARGGPIDRMIDRNARRFIAAGVEGVCAWLADPKAA